MHLYSWGNLMNFNMQAETKQEVVRADIFSSRMEQKIVNSTKNAGFAHILHRFAHFLNI